jgi:uncharacterized protein YukJ
MPLKRYGVLKGHPIERRLGAGSSPHYQVRLVDENDDYRIAINVKSQLSPSEVEYLIDDRFNHPLTNTLLDLPLGFTPLKPGPAGGGIDFIRANLFDRKQMRPLPFNVPGLDNDLNEKIDHFIQRAMANEDSLIYAFGERWGPETQKDKYFGFKPGNGIHDIHMNQGNADSFKGDDGVWQDGGLFIHFPSQKQWVGVFLKFQSQTWHTDDATGHRIGEPVLPDQPGVVPVVPPTTEEPQGLVRIVAALVNSIESPEKETVTVLNTAPRPVKLDGWKLADKLKNKHPLNGTLAAGETVTVRVAAPMQLSNKGGIITLLDDQGLKVDGVAYTAAQANQPGWTIVF